MDRESARLGVSVAEFETLPCHFQARMACRFLAVRLDTGRSGRQAERMKKLAAILKADGKSDAAVPVSWRIMKERDSRGRLCWTARASREEQAKPVSTTKNAGALGVDLNAFGVAWAFADADGNTRSKKRTEAEGKAPWLGRLVADWGKDASSGKILSECRRAAAELVSMARGRGCPLCLEALDFSSKKAFLRYSSPDHARMLSGFAFSKFREAVLARAEKDGVEVLWAEPSWSSVSGFFKFAHLGADPDEAAAVAIARACLLAETGDLRTARIGRLSVQASSRKERVPKALREHSAEKQEKTSASKAKKKKASSKRAASLEEKSSSDSSTRHSHGTAQQKQSCVGRAMRQSTQTPESGWRPASLILGKSRRLWRRNLAEFLLASRGKRGHGKSAADRETGPDSSVPGRLDSPQNTAKRITPSSTRFVNG